MAIDESSKMLISPFKAGKSEKLDMHFSYTHSFKTVAFISTDFDF